VSVDRRAKACKTGVKVIVGIPGQSWISNSVILEVSLSLSTLLNITAEGEDMVAHTRQNGGDIRILPRKVGKKDTKKYE
jgi:hypothetical protein